MYEEKLEKILSCVKCGKDVREGRKDNKVIQERVEMGMKKEKEMKGVSYLNKYVFSLRQTQEIAVLHNFYHHFTKVYKKIITFFFNQ